MACGKLCWCCVWKLSAWLVGSYVGVVCGSLNYVFERTCFFSICTCSLRMDVLLCVLVYACLCLSLC